MRVCKVCGGRIKSGEVHDKCKDWKPVGTTDEINTRLAKVEADCRDRIIPSVKHYNKGTDQDQLIDMFPDMVDRMLPEPVPVRKKYTILNSHNPKKRLI